MTTLIEVAMGDDPMSLRASTGPRGRGSPSRPPSGTGRIADVPTACFVKGTARALRGGSSDRHPGRPAEDDTQTAQGERSYQPSS